MRTITTNHTESLADMEEAFKSSLDKQMAVSQANLLRSLLDDGFKEPFGPVKTIIHRRVDRVTERKRMVSYSDGYWAKIEVRDDDHVSYKVFNSGWLAKTFNQIGFRKVIGNGWDAVKQRDTIEATLGATYMAIDEAIAEDLRKTEHSKFLKEMIKTDPENLKAIAQLDMLDKGDGPGAEQASTVGQVSAAQPSAINANSQNISISGSGTYSNVDPTKPSLLGVGSMALNADGEDLITVDSDGDVSFGNKMAKAIEATVKYTTEKGEVDES